MKPKWLERGRIRRHGELERVAGGCRPALLVAGESAVRTHPVAHHGAVRLRRDQATELAWRREHANLARLADKLNARQSFIDTQPPK